MNKERLLKLADHMEKHVQQEQYDQDWWLLDDGNDFVTEIVDGREFIVFKEGFCGTSGCIVGHACTIPEFQSMGLRLTQKRGDWIPSFGGADMFKAVGLFFEIPESHAFVLFGDSGNYDTQQFYTQKLTPTYVASRLREYVANPDMVKDLIYKEENE